MIDINKKYKTRDGREVVIYTTTARGDYPVHGAIKDSIADNSQVWTSQGHYFLLPRQDNEMDLIEVKPKPYTLRRVIDYTGPKEDVEALFRRWPLKLTGTVSGIYVTESCEVLD